MRIGTKRFVFGMLSGAVALSISLPAFAVPVSTASSATATTTEEKQPAWAVPFQAGKLAVAKNELDTAKVQLNEALKEAEKANDDQGIAEVCNQLANVYLSEGDIINASANAKRAKDAALKILMADPRTRTLASQLAANEENGSVWINHMMRAQFAVDKKDWKDAEAEYQLASSKAKEYAPDGMPMASALAGLGKVLVEEGKYPEAEPLLRQAIALCEKNWTPVTKNAALDAADAMERLSVVLDKTGRKEEAGQMTARSKEVRESKSLKSAATTTTTTTVAPVLPGTK